MISSCCSSPDHEARSSGLWFSDIGICPACKEHCDFLPDEEVDDLVVFVKSKDPVDSIGF